MGNIRIRTDRANKCIQIGILPKKENMVSNRIVHSQIILDNIHRLTIGDFSSLK